MLEPFCPVVVLYTLFFYQSLFILSCERINDDDHSRLNTLWGYGPAGLTGPLYRGQRRRRGRGIGGGLSPQPIRESGEIVSFPSRLVTSPATVKSKSKSRRIKRTWKHFTLFGYYFSCCYWL